MLPAPIELERIYKGIALLDAILSPEWESRYFSFDATWAPSQRMASMRNGSGDDRIICFTPDGIFFKAFWHEYPHEDPDAIFAGLPSTLASQRAEPAFEPSLVTFGGWHDGSRWTLRGNSEPVADDLAILGGDPERYRSYAAAYFGLTVTLDAIAHVLAGAPVDAAIVRRIHPERTLDDIAGELTAYASRP
ncbi:MAG TPA: hypothetical protein VGG74_09295 [Kofleriaceae bacterium]|jgi:hypothetical protein